MLSRSGEGGKPEAPSLAKRGLPTLESDGGGTSCQQDLGRSEPQPIWAKLSGGGIIRILWEGLLKSLQRRLPLPSSRISFNFLWDFPVLFHLSSHQDQTCIASSSSASIYQVQPPDWSSPNESLSPLPLIIWPSASLWPSFENAAPANDKIPGCCPIFRSQDYGNCFLEQPRFLYPWSSRLQTPLRLSPSISL